MLLSKILWHQSLGQSRNWVCRAMAASGAMALSVLGVAGMAASSDAVFGQQSWSITHKRVNPDAMNSNERLGSAVAISRNRAVVGAPGFQGRGVGAGAAWLYEVDTGNRILELVPSYFYSPGGNEFGTSVAIDGNFAAVGAPGDEEGPGGSYSGAVNVFSVATGTQLHKIYPDDKDSGDLFGHSVAISGNLMIAGAPNHSNGFVYDSGAAYVYDLITGDQVWKLVSSDIAEGDEFGCAVAIDGDRAVVGARWSYTGLEKIGAAYLFDLNTGLEIRKLVPALGEGGDLVGDAVAIDGDTVLVGAPYADFSDLSANAGAVYRFRASDGAELARWFANDPQSGDNFGTSVAISGNTALVGSYERVSDDGRGAAYFIDVATGNQLQKVIGTERDFLNSPGNQFGCSVSIDGLRAIIGEKNYDQKTFPDLTQVGAFYLMAEANAPTPLILAHTAGNCPGSVTLEVMNATPDSTVGLIFGENLGSYTIPTGQPCAGAVIDLSPPFLSGTPTYLSADSNGVASRTTNVPSLVCGTAHAQAVDGPTCRVSNLVLID